MLEAGWAAFTAELSAAPDLDSIIASHARYLDGVLQKALLAERSQLLLKQLLTLFDVVLRFRALADRVSEMAAAAAPPEPAAVAEYGAKLDAVAQNYGTLLEGFLNLLPVQKHVDLRQLLFRLDFSVRRERHCHSLRESRFAESGAPRPAGVLLHGASDHVHDAGAGAAQRGGGGGGYAGRWRLLERQGRPRRDGALAGREVGTARARRGDESNPSQRCNRNLVAATLCRRMRGT